MVSKIIVGYRTRLVPGADALMPDFKAPSNWKDEAKIAADVAAKKENFLANAKDAPYTGTFDSVFMLDSGPEKVLQWDYSDDPAKRVCVRVRNYLLKTYPNGWGDGEYDRKRPPFRVVGFGVRRFLKMLGIECSLPEVGRPLPPRMWYDNSEHRDIEEAVLPRDFDHLLDFKSAMKRRRPPEGPARDKWDAMISGWAGPHVEPERDARLTAELASQLGLLSE